jgi:hypothetical protein
VAQKVQVLLEDDLQGGPAEETVSFSLDGVSYEIDLNADNARGLRESLGRYLDKARKAGGRGSRGRGRSTRSTSASTSSGRTAEIREWAKNNGHNVSERGRIPSPVVEAFEAANS